MPIKAKSEIDEILAENILPEARASATFNVTSPSGFGVLITIRSMNEAEMFELLEETEAYLVKGGFTPEVKRSYGGGSSRPAPVVVEGELCPKCGNALVQFDTKTGKSGIKCSTSKWDNATKSASGCDYIKWNDDKPQTNGTVPASPLQRKVLESKGVWFDGMSYSEATELLTSLK